MLRVLLIQGSVTLCRFFIRGAWEAEILPLNYTREYRKKIGFSHVRDQALAAQQGENALAEPRLEQLARNGRQDAKAAVGVERAVRRKHVNVGVEVNEVAEGLDEQDETRPRAGFCVCITLTAAAASPAAAPPNPLRYRSLGYQYQLERSESPFGG
jgi:hypothetical protein